ncbi:MAG: Hpt domain-containing protein [Desulfuromonadales bacterium]|nr:Hpt domain-containing protein [Desulfuromonadales bacterium]
MTTHTEHFKTDKPGTVDHSDAIDWSVLDELKALQRPGKPDLRRQLMSVYLSTSPSLMNNVITAAETKNGQSLMSAAHALKSSSVSIGANILGKTCSELEQLGKTSQLDNVATIVKRAEHEFIAVCAAFRSALEHN